MIERVINCWPHFPGSLSLRLASPLKENVGEKVVSAEVPVWVWQVGLISFRFYRTQTGCSWGVSLLCEHRLAMNTIH